MMLRHANAIKISLIQFLPLCFLSIVYRARAGCRMRAERIGKLIPKLNRTRLKSKAPGGKLLDKMLK